jgi:methionyl aminopeptidase
MVRLKSKEQIKRIKDSGRILASTLQAVQEIVEEGQTTKEIDAFARDFIKKNSAKPAFLGYMDYPAALCISVNQEVIHGIPGRRKLKKGDIVGIDCGIEYQGYFSDSAFTLSIGKISSKAEHLMQTTRECLNLAIENATAGNRMHDISQAVYTHAHSSGYGIVRQFCGHGVGFSIHEDPQVPNYIGNGPNPRLKPGLVLAIEPMINIGADDVEVLEDGWTVVTIDGSLSAHFEHTIAIMDDHTEILTSLD